MAVYTRVSHESLSTLLDQYDLAACTHAEEIAEGVENTNYRLDFADNTRAILTLFEKRTDPADLPFFIEVMDVLAAANIPCPRPFIRRDGDFISDCAGKKAVLVSFLPGASLHAVTVPHFTHLGATLAHMHRAAQNITRTRTNALSLTGWRGIYAALGGQLNSITRGLQELVAEELEFLTTHWPQALPNSVIHADLFPDNVFFEGAMLTGVIDFYFACNDALMYDVAITLNAWCFDHNWRFDKRRAAAFLSAYHAVRPFTDAEMAALPVLARGAALRFLLTRAYDALNVPDGALVTVKDPKEYLAKLIYHQGTTDVGWQISDNG